MKPIERYNFILHSSILANKYSTRGGKWLDLSKVSAYNNTELIITGTKSFLVQLLTPIFQKYSFIFFRSVNDKEKKCFKANTR